MNKAGVISAAMATAWLLSPCASGLELPNDTDLKVAYCIGITTARISLMKGTLDLLTRFDHPEPRAMADKMRKDIREAEQHADRFDRYLNPRLKYLDQVPLVAAMKQADADAKRYYDPEGDDPTKARSNQLPAECSSECKGAVASKNKYSACYYSCIRRDELGARVLRCEEAHFLPF